MTAWSASKNLPGVVAASATCCVPLCGWLRTAVVIPGRALPQDSPYHGGGSWVTISPGYFDVFKIPSSAGARSTDQDTGQSQPVADHQRDVRAATSRRRRTSESRVVIRRGVYARVRSEGERQIIAVVGDVRDGG